MAIEAHNVTKCFGDFVALDDVSIDVESGSLTALLGPSGSGKSTLLRVIAGLEVADSGDVFISGKEAQVERIVRLGFETRVELVRDDGERLFAQLTRNEAEELELERGDIVYVRTRRERTFAS